jgi:two-component system sensor histidine kinase KdpD
MTMSDQLSAVAHDLRAPLTVITGTAAALRETAPAANREALDKIIGEAQRLGRMLENRIAAARMLENTPLDRQWMPVEDIVAGVLARLDSAIGSRHVDLAIADDAIAHIEPRLGELLLANVVDNAARYSASLDPIRIAAQRLEDRILIDIEDAGIGMPAHTRSDVSELARGKGLAVCRAIVVAHGGMFEISQRVAGGGTRVHVSIPDAEPRVELERE